MSTALTSRSRAASFRNSVATLVRRLISLFRRSSRFEVRRRRRWGWRKAEDGQALWHVARQPGREFRGRLLVLAHRELEPTIRFGSIRRIED